MAKVTRAQLQTWFSTGEIPTEVQYDDVWDSFQHLDDYVVEVFNDLSAGFADVMTTLPDPGAKTDAQIHQAVEVWEGRGTLLPLDHNVAFGYRINPTLNNIELIDKDNHPTKKRIPPTGTRLIVKINKKYI